METTISLSLEKIFRLSPYQKRALAKLGILSAGDLLRHFPARYGDVAVMKNIGDLVVGETAVVFGKISNLKISKAFYKKTPMAEAKITDESGGIKTIWFNQPYIAKMFLEEMLVRVEGKISEKKNKLYLSNPKIEKVEKIPIGVGESLFGSAGDVHHLYPVYPESRGISSNWLYHSIQKILKSGILENLTDPIPSEILQTAFPATGFFKLGSKEFLNSPAGDERKLTVFVILDPPAEICSVFSELERAGGKMTRDFVSSFL